MLRERELCGNDKCLDCVRKSIFVLGLHDMSYIWGCENLKSHTQVHTLSEDKYEITCMDCHHDMLISPSEIAELGGCPYCKEKLLCSDWNCEWCMKKSYRPCCEKDVVLSWGDNGIGPRQVFQSSEKDYLFKCKGCGLETLWDLYTAHLANRIHLAYQCDGCDKLALKK